MIATADVLRSSSQRIPSCHEHGDYALEDASMLWTPTMLTALSLLDAALRRTASILVAAGGPALPARRLAPILSRDARNPHVQRPAAHVPPCSGRSL